MGTEKNLIVFWLSSLGCFFIFLFMLCDKENAVKSLDYFWKNISWCTVGIRVLKEIVIAFAEITAIPMEIINLPFQLNVFPGVAMNFAIFIEWEVFSILPEINFTFINYGLWIVFNELLI